MFIRLYLSVMLMCFSALYADAHSIVDACGRNVSVPADVKRIVAIGPGAVPLTVYADVAKLLVARETAENGRTSGICSCSLPDNYSSLPAVFNNAPGAMPDYKTIINSKPDLILAAGFNAAQSEEIFQNTKLPVAAVNCNESGYMHYDAIVQSLRLTGYILKKEKAMQDIQNYLAKVRKDLYERSKDINKKKVFVISSTSESRNALTSEKCYCYLKLINMSNIQKKDTEGRFFNSDIKDILNQQPDYIFIEYNLLGRLKKDYLKNKSAYQQLNAVKAGRVYTILPYNRFSANLENMLINSYYIGKIVHPSGFAGVDMHLVADEITGELSGNDFYQELFNDTAVFKAVLFDDKGINLRK